MAIMTAKCPRCEATAKLRPRDFSDQAIATLISHGDLDKKIVGKSVCDDCYDDLRDAMIEHLRHVEKPAAASTGKSKKAG